MDVRRTTGLALLHSVVLWLWTVLSGSDSCFYSFGYDVSDRGQTPAV